MYTVTKFPQGTFSWADLITTDQATARQFYVDLMGWDTEDVPMGGDDKYTFFKVNGQRVAAVGPMPAEMRAQGVPSHWMNYISVDDVDAMVDPIQAAGGKVIAGPVDVFEDGRMLTLQDPTGAAVSLWQPKNAIGAGLVNTVGAMVWNELATNDVAAAQAFYTRLLGWQFQQDEANDYIYFTNNGRMNGGVIKITEDMQGMPPAWSPYFNVADIHATAAKAKSLGAPMVTDVMSAEPAGHFAIITDPTGGTFTAMQATGAENWQDPA